MTRLKSLAAAALGLGVAGPNPGVAETYNGYEQPAYDVERRVGDVEIRRYPPHVVAAVRVEGARDAALRKGFGILAGYIFGKNEGAATIDMTTPVAQQPTKIDMTVPVTQSGGGDVWTVTFMMPAQWTLDALPAPENDAIRFYETPAERLAVLRFAGLAGAARVTAKGEVLKATLDEAGIGFEDEVRSLFYDDPFTLPWRRRNEVAVRLID